MMRIGKGIYPLFVFFVLSVILLTLSRTALLIWHPEDIQGHLLEIYGYGLKYDISICCSLYSLPLVLCLICNCLKTVPKSLILVQRILLCVCICVLFLLEITTPSFILEYGVRPNHIYIEYLIYPNEVIATLYSGHLIEGIICICLTVLFSYGVFKLSGKLYKNYQTLSLLPLSALALCLPLLFFVGIRGSVIDHKPLNPSNSSFCSNPLANTLPVNSAFNVFYAFRHLNDSNVRSSEIYAFDTKENVLDNLATFSKRNTAVADDELCKINQLITPSFLPKKKRNIVIILEESFGARYVKSLGGDNVAVNLDALKNKGWWFENMYATGHRSVRGIEAVTASYPPGPLSSMVKIEQRQKLTTISSIYSMLGYKTDFIYGGESHFDNMRAYFLNNGVSHITEQKDYKKPMFNGSWGVSDEDLFSKANDTFVKYHSQGQPFCSVIFSSSFHDPFDIPEGKVDLDGIKTDDPKRLLGAKYADYALGKFFEKAQNEDYYKNTVFVIIADHDSRVRGIGAFPIENFHIPALIISPDITEHISDKRIVSQIDILPTILSLTGVSGEVPLVGQDLTKPDTFNRAPLCYNELYGYREGNNFTLLAPGMDPFSFEITDDNHLVRIDDNRTDIRKVVSYLNTGIVIYENNYQKVGCIKGLKQ
ncbi:MAG: LTA synthase family protein [Succinivibrio sp.]